MNWEQIDKEGLEFRCKVPNGWLVKLRWKEYFCFTNDYVNDDHYSLPFTTTFVEDHKHTWKIK